MSYEANEPCVCCGLDMPKMVCYHHIMTRKAHPELAEKDWNKIPVCQLHHNMFHDKGLNYMYEKFNSVKKWLAVKDWEFDLELQKWYHYEN